MGEDEAEIVAGGDNPSVGGINNAAEHVIWLCCKFSPDAQD
jgi:hypothetical protein